MSALRQFLLRVGALFRRGQLDRDMAEEMRFHLEERVADQVADGLAPDDARYAAQRKFGNVGLLQERARDQRTFVWLEQLLQDVRYAGRALRRNPGFTFVVVLTLALGIGANSAIFSVVNRVLWQPPPYRDPDSLLTVWESNLARNRPQSFVSIPNFQDWKERNTVFAELAAFTDTTLNLATPDATERMYTGQASADLFPLLGVQPLLGRVFTADEESRGERVLVLSHGLWLRRFGGDPGILGQTITGNDATYTVIGVLPPDFPLAFATEVPEAWMPLNPRDSLSGQLVHQRGNRLIRVLGRLRTDVTLAHAHEAMNALARELAAEHPDANAGFGVNLVPFREHLVGEARRPLLLLLSAVGFVLLVTCANVANLVLARSTARRTEIAIRAALGAGRGHVMRQLLTESMLLALMGGAAGVALGLWGTKILIALAPANIPRLAGVGLDGRILVFTLLLSLVTGVAFGLAPAWQAGKLRLNDTLRAGGRSGHGGRSRARHALVMAEVALSFVLLIGAGLLLRSFARLVAVDPGFNPENTLTLYVGLPETRYEDRARQAEFYRRLLEQTASLPGMQSVGVIFPLVLTDRVANRFAIEGRPPLLPDQQPNAYFRSISPDYFRAMGMPVLRGRAFTDLDHASAPGVVIINETMARQFWPDENPIGQRITINVRLHAGQDVPREIVGIVPDVRHAGLTTPAGPEMYVSYLQVPWPWMSLVARTSVAPASAAKAIADEVRALDGSIATPTLGTLESKLAASVAPQRFNLVLLGCFAGLALGLAALGIYSVMAFSVAQRQHEIGIRRALGAQAGDVRRLVFRQGLRFTGIGLAIGAVASLGLTGLMQTLLFDISATDPITFAAVTVIALSAALLACWLPARRATKVDPMVALRCE